MSLTEGIIVKALSGFYYVSAGEELISCRARGKFRLDGSSPLVGDRVKVEKDASGTGSVWEILPRRNRFVRPAVANIDLMVMVATDRISAFDVVLPKGIPFKGQVLNQIAAKFLDATTDICPNWKLATPDPMVTIGLKCEGFRVEMIIRSILTGSAWREYKNGCRELCGVKLPDGMRENERFPEPIITPTTKADEGHDMNISKEEIIAQGIVSAEDYAVMEDYTRRIFARGQEIAAKRGLILVDTKYEFGKRDGKVYLIDEIHTPDSSRYFYADGYEEKLAKGDPQRQLSKEFVRQWLIEHNFMNEPGQVMPEITDEYAESVSDRYIELYEHIVGEPFDKAATTDDLAARIEKNVSEWLKTR